MALPLILLLRQGITSEFSSPAFSLLIRLMGWSLKIWIPPFSEEHLLIMEWSLQGGSSGNIVCIEKKTIALILSKRNLDSLEYPMWIRGGSACPFLRQTWGLRWDVPSSESSEDWISDLFNISTANRVLYFLWDLWNKSLSRSREIKKF